MKRNRATLRTATTCAAALATLLALPAGAADRHPLAVGAEQAFFAALNAEPARRDDAIAALVAATAVEPGDARTALLLGLGHLWSAAEAAPRDARAIGQLVLAEHYLARAQALDPADDRIPSWLTPARVTLASIERTPEKIAPALASLSEAYARRPAFHSFSKALLASHAAPGSPRFEEGRSALRAVLEKTCDVAQDRACGNAPRWPHNREGFLLFAAEIEARAGDREAARALLARLRSGGDYATWPYRAEADELQSSLESGAAHAWPFGNEKRVSCQICHRGK